jgi:hypothetical protein
MVNNHPAITALRYVSRVPISATRDLSQLATAGVLCPLSINRLTRKAWKDAPACDL